MEVAMNITHPLKQLVQVQKMGIAKGAYSACSANEYVIEAVLQRALASDMYVYIEATANQVNQFGGYTNMTPYDFRNFVYSIASKQKFPIERIILGGDHLGPLTWKNEKSEIAMEKSIQLIKQYVGAGFSKIHIDTSMHLADDDAGTRLDTRVIAERSAILCKAAQDAYAEHRLQNPNTLEPVYVIGSEVPIPGGSQEAEIVQITKPEDFEETVETFKKVFCQKGLTSAWDNVVAVVVQPGVEFGDDVIHEYNRSESRALCNSLKRYPQIVFEGHSTDYQTSRALRQMVEDGIAILKVGPALTFALREGLFALNYIENELFKYDTSKKLSNFIDVLDNTMVKNRDNWEKHYHGSDDIIRLARKYSLSDRARYYLPLRDVREALNLMLHNMNSVKVPLTLISEYMPIQYNKIRNGLLKNAPEELIKDRIINCIDDYIYAISSNN